MEIRLGTPRFAGKEVDLAEGGQRPPFRKPVAQLTGKCDLLFMALGGKGEVALFQIRCAQGTQGAKFLFTAAGGTGGSKLLPACLQINAGRF